MGNFTEMCNHLAVSGVLWLKAVFEIFDWDFSQGGI
jgi:hypothetical protein